MNVIANVGLTIVKYLKMKILKSLRNADFLKVI